MKFSELNVAPDILEALEEIDITEATTIQQKAIPLIREGKDVVGISRTGSGKTLAFCLPLLEKVDKNKNVQFLILSPVRELALQIAKELKRFGRFTQPNIAIIYGGVAYEPQIKALEKANIVVGTPGRVLDLLKRGDLNIAHLESFVLDEADKMVDMGFIEDVKRILKFSNDNRQILLFGATISREIEGLKRMYMKDPQTAKAELKVKEDLLEQYYYDVKRDEKLKLLTTLLKNETSDKVIVFCSTISGVNFVGERLKRSGVKADAIHGRLTQNRRQRVVDSFNKGHLKVLVASPVAARGLHVNGVTHVYNYDLSQNPQEYVHRVGRTARAGKTGKAITLLSKRDHDVFRRILDQYKMKITKLDKNAALKNRN